VPDRCEALEAATAIGAGGTHRLMISERAPVDAALRRGLVQALCEFLPGDDKVVKTVCDAARPFAGSPN